MAGQRQAAVELLTKRQKELSMRAEIEGIALVLEADPRQSVQGARHEIERVEAEWVQMAERAQREFTSLRTECRRLVGVLGGAQELIGEGVPAHHLAFIEESVPPSRTVRQAVRELYTRLEELASDREAVVLRCLDIMRQLGATDEQALDRPLSRGRIGGLEEKTLRLVQEHRKRISGDYKQTYNELAELLDCLSAKADEKYQLDLDAADPQLLLALIDEMRQSMGRLRAKAESARELGHLLRQRRELIQQMQVFEKTASDPARLFAPSFRLLQEEKFRKTAIPTLQKIEQRLFRAAEVFEQEQGEPYLLGGEPLSRALEREIDTRFLNEAVFGFHKPAAGPTSPAGSSRKENVQATVNAGAASSPAKLRPRQ